MLVSLTWQSGLAVAIATFIVAVGLIVWSEGRKEVVFLCGNFAPGVTEQSVLRQLETGEFLRYRQRVSDTGSRIVADSAYTFGIHTCAIELSPDNRVTRVTLDDG